MQSEENSFGGYVSSGSFNKTLRDEENILDQVYMYKQICSDYFSDDINSL